MINYENDPKMPWNQRSFLDTFWKNAAFERLAVDMIAAKNEMRLEKIANDFVGPPCPPKSYEERAVEYYNKYGTQGEF